MAAKGISSVNMNPQRFMTLLSSAACEWFLIFLVFVDAALSYLLTKFAHYCELQTPCLLCSRLDHVFGNEKPGYYRSLLCSNHSTEISSLVSCHIHGELADVRGMCEECLMSFAIRNKSNSKSYKLLVGKLGMDFEQHGFQGSFLENNSISSSLGTINCTCCNKSRGARSKNAQRLLQLSPVGLGASKANVKPPLPRFPGRSRFSRRDSLKRIRDKFSGPMSPRRNGNTGVDALSHVGYTKLKITSDSESEVQFSDDEDGSSVSRKKTDSKKDLVIQHSSGSLPKTQTKDVARVQKIDRASNPGPSLLDQSMQLHTNEANDVKSLASNNLGELNWEQTDPKPNPSVLPELISLDDVPASSNAVEVPFGLSAEKPRPSVPHSHMSTHFELCELISLSNVPSSSKVVEIPPGVTPEKATGTSDIGHTPVTKHAELSESLKTTTRAGLLNDAPPSMPSNMDLTDLRKSAVSNKGRQLSSMLEEQLAINDSGKVNEDLKSFSQASSIHETEPSLNATSPRVYGHHEVLQTSDASSSEGTRAFRRSVSLERNDSGFESPDGSGVSEIEGESVVDRLKRQVEYERRCMNVLYKELEEERSASAIAANQAMAMITRLQEEKAALHMEALQYLRMMEEQAEYDMDALQKANDLLAEKEKELQDLEAELEVYRSNFPDESVVQNLHEETCKLKGENMKDENSGLACFENNVNAPWDSSSIKIFKDEKLYISQCLTYLRRNLHQVSGNGASSDIPNGGYSEKITNRVDNQEELPTDRGTQTDNAKEENSLSMQTYLSASNGNPCTQGASASFVEENHLVCEENNGNHLVCEENSHFDSHRQIFSVRDGEIDLATLENEISNLSNRLEALEADSDFLEHVCNSLRNGKDGLKFIQEIALQLQELRKIAFKR